MKKYYTLLLGIFLTFAFTVSSKAQILNPNDPIINYDPENPPSTPPWDSIGKWVRTPRLGSWTNSYKSYYYKGMVFRLMFPKSWESDPTKDYPLIIFLHGVGERGTIYDNEWSLRWEGQNFVNAENSGKYDGFVLYPQSTNGYWGEPYYTDLTEIIDYMIKNVKVDPNRVLLSGLSSGGSGVWAFLTSYPKYFAGAEIISSAYTGLLNYINNPLKYIPIWLSQGGIDGNPSPYTSQQIINALQNVGADITYTVYPNVGHGVWNLHYAEPDTYPWFNRKNKANPIVFFDKREFCPSDTDNINITLGLTPGFDGYEWRKDGAVIQGANSNILTVSSLGTYDARIKRGSEWSYWSPAPIVVKVKEPTQTPDIQVNGLMSKVIPSPDGHTSVNLTLPPGYTSYEWRMQGGSTVLGTEQTYTATQPGNYVAKVTEQFGCSSNFSLPFHVADNNGPNPPDPATNLSAFAVSQTAIQLNWNNNPSPVYNETGFELYRSLTAGGPYTLIHINQADSLSYVDQDLSANTRYYYVVRAIDSTGAAAPTTEINTLTLVDKIPPSAPADLRVTATSRNSISLNWKTATDNVGISRYAIYINGVKSYVTSDTTFTVNSLTQGQLYAFAVKAQDPTGNYSPLSNQVTAPAILTGLNYSYYTFTGTWNDLPDFDALTPAKTGSTSNVDISQATQADRFAFKWTGYIQIPEDGTYTFSTSSDDGSRLYINTPYSYGAIPLVDNDGLHGNTLRSGTITLEAGTYPFTATFYEQGGDAVMNVYWQSTALNNNNQRTLIPDSAFQDAFTSPGTPPEMPSGLKATAISYDQINLAWNDNSNNESGFEIYRATSLSGSYNIIATTGANTTSYQDSTCAPQTTYYYKIQAINQYGSSGFNPLDAGGLNYAYYETGSLNHLPDFNTLTPQKTGIISNFDIGLSERDNYFAFKFNGTIEIPTTGEYTFYTKSDDGSKLYIGDFNESNLVVNNDYLQAPTERSGNITLTAGTYPIIVTFFEKTGGQALEVRYKGPGIAKELIPSVALSNPDIKAKTFPLPAIPSIPDDLTSNTVLPDKIILNWNDNSSNEDGFKIYRSVHNNSNYLLLADLASNKTSYSDSSLYPNVTYYYKITAYNAGGESGFSNELSVKTLDNPPVLTDIDNFSMRYNTTMNVDLIATDPDNEQLTYQVSNLPDFATFDDYGDGTGLITFNPSLSQQGTYNNIKVLVHDQNGGKDSSVFNLFVNDNYPPEINPISNTILNAGTSVVDTIVASDNNAGDNLSWTVNGLPPFITKSNPSNDTLLLFINPGYNDAGEYNLQIKVNDGNEGIDNKVAHITINNYNPDYKVYINFTRNDPAYNAGGYWNNSNVIPHENDTISHFHNDKLEPVSIGLQILTPWENIGDGTNVSGMTTGDNSGIYPDVVLQSAYWTNSTTQQIKIFGLSTDQKHTYDFTLLGSRYATNNRNTDYAIRDTTVTLNAASNTSNTVSITKIQPNPDGSVILSLKAGSGSSYGYLNAMVINVHYNDGEAPATPGNLSALFNNNDDKVHIFWKDNAYNETGYEIYRSESETGNYTLLNTVGANDTLSIDSTIIGNKQYYYKVRSVNNGTFSAFIGPVSVSIPRKDPVIAPISDINMNSGSQKVINIVATPGQAETILTLDANNIPSFATFQDLGNGQGKLTLSPTINDVGLYTNVSISVSDDIGGSATQTFSIQVMDSARMRILINFNEVLSVGSPWNSTNSAPSNGLTLSNLINDMDVPTTVGLQLQEWWGGANSSGASTGNNSGVFPDSVMKTSYYIGNSSTKHILITGLSPEKRYSFTFFGSRAANDNRITYYTIGDTTVSLNAASNTKDVVKIENITPSSNGEITIGVYKDANASYGYLNAMVIELYQNNGQPEAPTNLKATTKSSSLIQLSWVDNANDETGYEIWRSFSHDGTYSLITTTEADVSGYEDNTLSANTRYFYKIRAVKNDTTHSGFSQITAATTLLTAVYVNFNHNSPASTPWNNTNTIPLEGDVYGPLTDEGGYNTGINLKYIGGFQDVNESGMNTGNNSGIYPDNVIFDSYWLNQGDTATLKLTGLNLTMKYNLVFFASRAASNDRTTLYNANGETVGLQAANNINNTVQISNISPDENGEIQIKIYAGVNSSYGYIGAMVIQEYNNYDDNGNIIYGVNGMINRTRLSGDQILEYSKPKSMETGNMLMLNVYPNPFHNSIHVRLNSIPEDGKTSFELFDLNGRKVYQKNAGKLRPGINHISLDVSGSHLVDQMYILKVTTSGNLRTGTIKLIHY